MAAPSGCGDRPDADVSRIFCLGNVSFRSACLSCREPGTPVRSLSRLVILMASRRINFRSGLLFVLLVVGAMGGIYVLHKFQVRRNAAALLATVDVKLAEGSPGEAIDPLLKYLTLRPADNQRYLQLAEILADRAFSTDPSRDRWAMTKEVLRTAVTRNPDEDDLREKLVILLLEAN